ncbi:hypothetical protein HRR83_001770 [Exophiala dermatitidis]|uniref:Zn(2)-C6 fungal-type domain-containing protein n=2 Tax=Exophiala dermatitidis TaxID=5970 RepID=H6C5B9_EXODN|nr:uncharacterized protein HMPREF1120_06966 [Exophiala dermatitidis NIH/UT8656]KAJ4516438.1 hypothetical protein HRR73_004903 [Exophiala dermatitidis]EHY58965.1 hypothetical protein HMPREF1120_06966 [Exophiala dermatitidis NIH/UT8656]KAJ4523236.1 hypothetical protein HRR75_001637 [Exophiala dermatitidis]KAJ4526573.1 hypothetical protein HRR74_001773 [Exophiala dermatitidis]KAJ4532178.1 hypothetical protein HRR76_007176 [Exophiala dermatitidis]
MQEYKFPHERQARGSRHRTRTSNRTLIACINCKEKKLKCDNNPSGCENCLRFGSVCLVEDPATRRQQPRNYLATLEQRVAFLEGIVNQYQCHDPARNHPQHQAGHVQQPQPEPGQIPSYGVGTPFEIGQGQYSPGGGVPSNAPAHTPVHVNNPGDETHAQGPDGLDELASKVGLLSLNAAGAEPHYLGTSSIFAFSRVINSALRNVFLRKPQTTVGNNNDSDSYATRSAADPSTASPRGIDEDNDYEVPTPCLLPEYPVAVQLSNAYFQNIHYQYPFLHEPTFRLWEATLVGKRAGFDTLISNPIPLFFLNMVYAVGALLLPNLGYSAERLYMSAQLYVDNVMARDNLESIQAILCCAVYSVWSSIGTSHWKLAGLALRQCIDLGYHRSCKHLRSSTTDPLRLELRKRVFWCAYSMECQSAVMLGRPLALRDQEIDAEYPSDAADVCGAFGSSSGDSSTNLTMTRAIHTFRGRRILGRIHTTIYLDSINPEQNPGCAAQRIQQLRGDLESWRAAIPPTMPRPIEAQPLVLFGTQDWFEMEYNYAILQLYRVQIIGNHHRPQNPHFTTTTNTTSTSASTTAATTAATTAMGPNAEADAAADADGIFLSCLRAAERTCHIYRRHFLGRPTNYTWAALHELFLAGLTYLHCLWTSPAARAVTRQGQVSNTCTDCTIVLVIIAERWSAAAPYRDIFEALANLTMTMMDEKAGGDWTTTGVGTGASTMLPNNTPGGVNMTLASSARPFYDDNDDDEGDSGDFYYPLEAPAATAGERSSSSNLMEWMTSIADTGMSEGLDGLLSSLIGDLPPLRHHEDGFPHSWQGE